MTEAETTRVLEATLSPARLGTYIVAAGHDMDRALLLYIWNAKVGESFHVLVQAVEVALRNRINHCISGVFGDDWWHNAAFQDVADDRIIRDLDTVKVRLRRKNIPVTNGQIVAGLSFGFWVAMLDGRFNPKVWSQELRRAFPSLPDDFDRQKSQKRVREIAEFRNRISHHEPILKRDLFLDYNRCVEVLGWLCSTKVEWIRPHSRVLQVLREKP
jgi:hypothetical protein